MTTNAAATGYSNQRKLDRCQNGNLVTVYADTTSNGVFKYSTDDGLTWASAAPDIAGFTNGSIFVDIDDYLNVVWKQNGTGGSRNSGWIYYVRGTPNTGRTAWTWSAVTSIRENTTGDYPDVVVHRENAGWKVHTLFSVAASTPENYAFYHRIDITSGGVASVEQDDLLLGGSYSVNLHTFPSIDLNHTGDGKTVAGSTPHLYAAWSAGKAGAGFGVRFRKAAYSAGTWTWGTEREIDNAHYVLDIARWLNCLFDGTRIIITGMVETAGLTHDLILHDRDAADTTTTARTLVSTDTPGTNLGLWTGSATYDSNGSVYLLGGDYNGIATRYRQWSRSTSTLGAVVTLQSETLASGAGQGFFSAKRGYSSGRVEWVYTSGNNSPYAVKYDQMKPLLITAMRPDSITVETSFTGSYTSLRDATSDGADATWVSGTSNGQSVLHVTFDNPSGTLKKGSDIQMIQIKLRPSP